jgi:hypothetical protein
MAYDLSVGMEKYCIRAVGGLFETTDCDQSVLHEKSALLLKI